jgi:hypothetical protein
VVIVGRIGRLGPAIGSLLLASPLIAQAHDDQAAPAEWIPLVVFSALAVVMVVVAAIAVTRNINPHTGLPSKIKPRRHGRRFTRKST